MNFQNEAIRLSRIAPGGPFGAVIIKNDEIIGRGFNSVIPNKDPTAHAEMMAIRSACQNIGSHSLKNCTLYTSCEPCAMCMAASYWSGISEINYSNTRVDAENIGFSDKYIYEQLNLPLDKRDINMIHQPNKEARNIFKEWHGEKY